MRRVLLAFAAATFSLSSTAPSRAGEPVPDSDLGVAVSTAALPGRIWVLKSPGVCDGCAEAISKMLFTVGIPSQILGPGQLKGAVQGRDVLIIGGGIPDGEGEWAIKQDLVKAGAFDWLKRHIADGGRYVGICAGAYLTEKWIDEAAGESGLDIFPGRVDVYSEGKKPKYLLTRWMNGVQRRVYFQDGPAFYPAPGANVSILGSYARDNVAAAAVFPYGKGKVGVLSPHLEADEEWATQANFKDPDGIDYDLGIAFIRKAIE